LTGAWRPRRMTSGASVRERGLAQAPARYFERLSGKVVSAFRDLVQDRGPVDLGRFEDVLRDAIDQRMGFAKGLLDSAKAMPTGSATTARNVISRSYYAMYHAGRAVQFAFSRADIDDHQAVASKLPDDFPESAHWRDRLKFWRIKRDKADYEPWIEPTDSFELLQPAALREASRFIEQCQSYLRERGMTNV